LTSTTRWSNAPDGGGQLHRIFYLGQAFAENLRQVFSERVGQIPPKYSLALLGFHIYKINTLKQEGIIVIVKGKAKKDDWLYCKHISDNIYYAKLQQ
jgi:hypothetical protein